MAFRVIKQRREARRNAKLEEIFQERDKMQNETISVEDMKDVFRIYGLELSKTQVNKISNSEGFIEKADFIKCAQDMKLLDFTGRKVDPSLMMGFKDNKKEQDPNIKIYRAYRPYVSVVLHTPNQTPKKEKEKEKEKPLERKESSLKLLLHCCSSQMMLSPDIEDPNDRVEVAFRRLDSDGDGYLHLEDFVHIGWPIVENNVDQNQLQRIFHHCDQTGDGRVSLQEFRELAQSNGDLTMEGMFD